MRSMRFMGRRTRLAGALALAGVITLVFASVAGAQTSPSEYPPPPPSPLAPPDWDIDNYGVLPMLGDVNFDARHTVTDSNAIARHAISMVVMELEQVAVADVNGDGRITVSDSNQVARYAIDPTGAGGVLTLPLWEWPRNAGVKDPSGQNAG